jgi:predicted peptidase
MFVFAAGGAALADPPRQAEVKFDYKTKDGDAASIRALLYLPADYEKDKDQKWPLVMFLHGAGERGDDLEKVKIHGPPKLVEKGKEFPFIVVSPQCPDGRFWRTDELKAVIDGVVKDQRVDEARIYCTGLSMGGYGTWSMLAEYPDLFAAAVPICGGGDTAAAEKIKHVPLWVFHGDEDTAVPFKLSQEMVDALEAAGGNVKFTVYEGVGHDSWTQTYDNPEVYEWLLEQKRK